jgi:hypothetical protein
MRRLPVSAGLLALCGSLLFTSLGKAQFRVEATRTKLIFRFDTSARDCTVAELAPFQPATDAAETTPVLTNFRSGKIAIPRFDGSRDRLYSGFVEVQDGKPMGPMRFADAGPEISVHRDSYPRTHSKKGLQVQWVEDAIALGVQHAGLNIDLGRSIAPTPRSNDLRWTMDGRDFWFDHNYIESIDSQVKPLSDYGAAVTLILLDYTQSDRAHAFLRHPSYDPACPGHISEFNTSTPESLAWFKAWVEFLAARYTQPASPRGRVVNYIIGNEVNAHWDWANMGAVSMETFAADYIRAVRISAQAVRKYSASARVYISLEHDWNNLYAESSAQHGFAARSFIDHFNQLARAGGNFDWNLAFHPYPEDLFNCRTWEDKSAPMREDAPRITFKNIEMLPRYFRHESLLYRGNPRHIILSEQGFHAKPTHEGEMEQAAAYCYAWRKIVDLNGIDAFILHRQVDNRGEGGLNLGLWRREPDSDATPSTPRPIYNVFLKADTAQWKAAFQFALPILGLSSWAEMETADANAGR